jgi:hypothetical protein
MAAAWPLHGHAAWAWLLRGMLLLQNRDAWCMACCCFKPGMHGACVWHVASRMFESSKLHLCRSTAVLNFLVPCLILLLEKVRG